MTQVQTETIVQGLGIITFCDDAAFHNASKAVLQNSSGLISMRDLAYARIKEGKDSSLSQYGSYVREGSLFVPKADTKRIWLRESLVLQNPADAVKAHKKDTEYLLPKNFNVEAHLEKVGKDNYFIVTATSAVPTNRFGNDPRTVWAFQDQAEEYGKFLEDVAHKSSVHISMHNDYDTLINRRSRPFANQLWLNKLDYDSDIDGDFRDLVAAGMVRGVLYTGDVLATPNSRQHYSVSQVRALVSLSLDETGFSGAKDSIISDLEKRMNK